MLSVHIIRGLPGSGKSTFARQLAKALNATHVEADMYFIDESGQYVFDATQHAAAHAWCQERAEKNIAGGRSVVVSNTFTRKWEMQFYIELARRHNAALFITKADNDFGNVHNVPDKVISSMRNRWEAV